ncbi:hypothetical protein [Streptomyces sp. NPDC056721]|uniref:hypothetical protein n=1 Tax=unclassified Streptomyces TaxID=2593676 RepID=UPI003640E797
MALRSSCPLGPGARHVAIDAHKVTTMVGTVENYLEILHRPEFASCDLIPSSIRRLEIFNG